MNYTVAYVCVPAECMYTCIYACVCMYLYVCVFSTAYSHVVALTFDNIDYADAHRYRCKTLNYTGHVHSDDLVLNVLGQPVLLL